ARYSCVLLLGQGEEHLVECRSAQNDVIGGDVCGIQASDCRSEIACAPGGGRGHDSRLLVEIYYTLLRRRRACRKQRISDGPGSSLMTRGDLDPVTASLTFEITRSPLGDDSPGLHDRDSTRQTVGLLEILRGQQHRCTSGGDLPHRVPHVGASPW